MFSCKQFRSAVLLLSAFCLLATQPGWSAGIFRELTLDTAKTDAQKDSKILIIDFTASWCGPCHKMEATTWSDPTVQKWVAENAIAIQFDVDKDKDISSAFHIMAMPSMVVFAPKDYSKEFDRQVGYQTSTELLDWLNGVKKGETSLDLLKHSIEKMAGKGGEEEVKARFRLLRALLEANKYDDAVDQFVWLWQNIPTQMPALGGVRISFLAGQIATLAPRINAIKDRFGLIRDEAEKNNQLLDFVVLNEALGQNDRTLEWFDKVKNDATQKDNLKQVDFVLVGLLVKKNRWKDVILLFPDPIAEIRSLNQKAPKVAEDLARMGIKEDPFAKDAARIYASALAAKRESDARKIAAEILKLHDTPDMRRQLVQTALEAKQPRKDQLKWVSTNKELTEKLQEALKTAKLKK